MGEFNFQFINFDHVTAANQLFLLPASWAIRTTKLQIPSSHTFALFTNFLRFPAILHLLGGNKIGFHFFSFTTISLVVARSIGLHLCNPLLDFSSCCSFSSSSIALDQLRTTHFFCFFDFCEMAHRKSDRPRCCATSTPPKVDDTYTLHHTATNTAAL